MTFKIGGHLPDPDDGESLKSYWDFSTQLRPHLAPSPGDVDLRPFSSDRHNQGNTGSCVAQAVVKALENMERQQICQQRGIKPSDLGENDHQNLSVLALYYLCREFMQPSQVTEDSGTYPSLACDCLRRFGVCTEEEWPFEPDKLLFKAPSFTAMKGAFIHRLSAFYRITETGDDRVQSILDALRANHPVVYGTDIGDEWQSYKKGKVLKKPKNPEGGHATHLVGWDDTQGVLIGENSWGTHWGDDGYYLLAPEVVADNSRSRDFWVITGIWEVAHQ
ncbi:MAG: C1 family peptidase [Candidatus Methylumidiphilus sp.]